MIIDVRSPTEYAKGHIIGAHNIPLLDDDERAEVGTCYKQQGQLTAVNLGFKIVSPKVSWLIDQFTAIASEAPLKIYCWRGGMRSDAVRRLLKSTGFSVEVLPGGYKAYRQDGAQLFGVKWKLKVLGGFTGTGKTETLAQLKSDGEQVLDLEALANHRGSAFGALGMEEQPTTEHFHNLIADVLRNLDPNKPLWVEDESRLIGTCHLPEVLFTQMQQAPLYVIEKSLDERLQHLNKIYGSYSDEAFYDTVGKIGKKLGGANVALVRELLAKSKRKEAATLLLQYYDQAYRHHMQRRPGPGFPFKEFTTKNTEIGEIGAGSDGVYHREHRDRRDWGQF